MTTFILVPGACHGGWYYEPITRRLRAEGHDVFPVTLTGVADRAHLASAPVNLDTHIQDVAAFIEQYELNDVVLCGHSYAGMVITGVADRMPERIHALVYVDAEVPLDGQSAYDIGHGNWRTWYVEGAAADGYSMNRLPFFDQRATSHPLPSLLQRIRLTGAHERVPYRSYLYLSGLEDTPYAETYNRISADPRWRARELPVGHDIMGEAPDELWADLMAAAQAG